MGYAQANCSVYSKRILSVSTGLCGGAVRSAPGPSSLTHQANFIAWSVSLLLLGLTRLPRITGPNISRFSSYI